MERQWSLKRERARYDAERARRQYDAVEPENRLVARSLERVWEERLRRVDRVEQEYDAWRREQSVSISDNDRAEILALGEELPRLWRAATTRSTDRKQIVRLVIKDVALDQKRRRGYVWIKVIWQTGARKRALAATVACKATSNTPIRTVSGNVSPSLTGSRRWMARSQRFSTRRRSAQRMERRSPAAWFMFCGRGGGSRASRSTVQPRTRSSGPTEATRSRAPPRPSASHLRSYSIGSEKGG